MQYNAEPHVNDDKKYIYIYVCVCVCVCVDDYIYIYIYMLPYPRRVELSSEWSNRVAISVYARLFIYELSSR